MIQDSQLLLSDLMEQSEIPVGSETYQGTDFVAGIFNCIELCDPYLDRFFFRKGLYFNLKLLSLIFKLP